MPTSSIVASMYNSKRDVIDIMDKLFFPSLLRNGSGDKQFILLDDASPLERETNELVAKFSPELRRTYGDFTHVRNPSNLGFGGSYNKGMRLADGANLIITNDDVYFPLGSIDGLLEGLREPRAGLIGPVTNCAGSYQVTRLFPWIKDYSDGEQQRIEAFSQQLRQKVARKLIPVPRLIAFCTAISGDLIREIGYLDESFTYAMYEDDDYCIRTWQAGYRVLVNASVFVEHGGPLGGGLSVRQDPLKSARYMWKNMIKLARKHNISYRRMAAQTLECILQAFFDKRTVTAELKRYLGNDHLSE